MTAASLYLGLPLKADTLADAAVQCGTNVTYLEAAISLLRSENADLIARALAGDVQLMRAAEQIKQRAELIAALRRASPEDRAAAGRAFGVAAVFDDCIVPNLG